ncbi:MAG: MucB/RseB C-terminal domain-containing protein [Succinivibrio sp.]|jgi:negative regulator of sigma E activity|nr:MucB/RseB C-terminal domain-containing protein [Succinivibrio sp.]
MLKLVKTACSLMLLAVLFSPASYAASDPCMGLFDDVQKNFAASSLSFTAVAGDQRGMFPYAYTHVFRNGREYVSWRALNGEVAGYALRDLKGYEFNDDKGLTQRLTWHQTQVFDRLMAAKTQLEGYQCVFSGRTRLSGRKVSLLRLSPKNDQRYGFALALDDDQKLPVELNLITPQGALVFKITAADIVRNPKDAAFDDEMFDKFDLLRKAPAADEKLDPWGFIRIPPYFTMVSEGSVQTDDGSVSPYQQFSDGIFSFRVYINSRTSMYLKEVTAGSLSVYRTQDANREYAVTGDIPMELAHSILAEIDGSGRKASGVKAR